MWSGRCSGVRDSGRGVGDAGSPGRHSHAPAGGVTAAAPAGAGRAFCGRAASATPAAGESQQPHEDIGRTAQQDLVTSASPLVPQADASPATVSIPTIAARATQESRRWEETLPTMRTPQ